MDLESLSLKLAQLGALSCPGLVAPSNLAGHGHASATATAGATGLGLGRKFRPRKAKHHGRQRLVTRPERNIR